VLFITVRVKTEHLYSKNQQGSFDFGFKLLVGTTRVTVVRESSVSLGWYKAQTRVVNVNPLIVRHKKDNCTVSFKLSTAERQR